MDSSLSQVRACDGGYFHSPTANRRRRSCWIDGGRENQPGASGQPRPVPAPTPGLLEGVAGSYKRRGRTECWADCSRSQGKDTRGCLGGDSGIKVDPENPPKRSSVPSTYIHTGLPAHKPMFLCVSPYICTPSCPHEAHACPCIFIYA